MAEVKPIPVEEAKEKTKKALNTEVPRIVNDINNLINAAANAGKYEAYYSIPGEYTAALKEALSKFENAGYYINIVAGSTVTIKWSK
jgi:hypothetical protein